MEPELIAIALVVGFVPIANLMVCLRFYTRNSLRRQKRQRGQGGVKLGWDDILILPALV